MPKQNYITGLSLIRVPKQNYITGLSLIVIPKQNYITGLSLIRVPKQSYITGLSLIRVPKQNYITGLILLGYALQFVKAEAAADIKVTSSRVVCPNFGHLVLTSDTYASPNFCIYKI